jgi:hypothetical protein|tara:strand:+ start:1012 stop:1554 length:543 start_codon:yes stop_codon:yes gene_type:complete
MNFQNIELYETDKFQYLLIHKNASHSIIDCIKHLNPIVTNKVNFNKIRWTIIREPYERFVSGLKYDLKRHNQNIKDIDYPSLFNCKINTFSRKIGNVNHTASQIPYLINTHVNWYIELKDLDIFTKMHFNKVEYCNKDKINIKLNLDEQEIKKYLQLDYYVYNNILNSNYLWKWQQGKIF